MKTKLPTYNKSDLIKTREWSDTLIENFAGEPYEIKRNPNYWKAGAPMRLWLRSSIHEIEQTPAFQEALAMTKRYRQASNKAVATKIAKTRAEYSTVLPTLKPKLSRNQLRRRAVESHNIWTEYRSMGAEQPITNSKDVPPDTLKRWMVNYLRHQHSNYDTVCESLAGKVGKDEVYMDFKNSILTMIAEEYPYLAEECKEQMFEDQDQDEMFHAFFSGN